MKHLRLATSAGALAAAGFFLALASPARADDPRIPHERYRLDNGLEVILHQDRSVPLVAVTVWYHVGSGDETRGKSGFAHLFEHMMFQGAKHIGEDVHFDVLKKAGASMVNGTTNSDRTNYFEVLPSNQLETALWLESDRMGYLLALLSEKSLDNQREVVRNERRQSYENRPYGKEVFALAEALYAEGHPYRYTTIGRHEDLVNASVNDVAAFFRKWYVPANATLTLAGDFDTAEAKTLVAKWFGGFPRTERPRHEEVAPTPVTGPKRVAITDAFAKLRRMHYAWHSPRFFGPGDAELDILADALGREGTGRLYKILVLDKQLAQEVSVVQDSQQMSSTFEVVVDLKTGADQAEVERILDEELARVAKEPIGKKELDRAVAKIEAAYVWGLESLMARAETLERYNHYVGATDYITQDLDRYRKTTVERVRDVAAQFLAKSTRVEVVTTPAAQPVAQTGGN